MKRRPAAFKFQKFSRKQLKVVTWWREGSPYKDWDGIICDGAIRSGKTIAFILGFILWSTTAFAEGGYNFIISGRTIGTLKRNVVSPMLAILAALKIAYTYNRSENYLVFKGNTYYLFGADKEDSQDKVQGLTAAGWLADEAALHHIEFVRQALGRLLSIDNSKFWWNCNPESPQHPVKTDYINKSKELHILRLRFSLDDNLTLTEKAKERAQRMFSGVFFKRYILGLWVAAEGAIYDMFDEAVHVVDKLPKIKKYWVFSDYGTANPTVFLLIGESEDKRFYVCDEWRWDSRKEGQQKTDSDYCKALYKWIDILKVHPQFICVDPSAASFIAELKREALLRQVKNQPFIPVKKADNEVLDGIRRTGTLFSLTLLLISRKCKDLIKEITGYVWDPKAQEKGEDKPLKQADHGPDCLRYFSNYIRATRPYLITF